MCNFEGSGNAERRSSLRHSFSVKDYTISTKPVMVVDDTLFYFSNLIWKESWLPVFRCGKEKKNFDGIRGKRKRRIVKEGPEKWRGAFLPENGRLYCRASQEENSVISLPRRGHFRLRQNTLGSSRSRQKAALFITAGNSRVRKKKARDGSGYIFSKLGNTIKQMVAVNVYTGWF